MTQQNQQLTNSGPPSADALERALILQDLSGMNPEARLQYYKAVCDSLGLNALTRPFAYITLNNKMTLYALKDCTEQLRKIHEVSIEIVSRDSMEGIYVVTVRASNTKTGRKDESVGAVPFENLKGEARANALMKAECVPMDSEILTRDGFKTCDQVNVGDAVLSYDPVTDRCAWGPLLEKKAYADQPIVELRTIGQQFSVRCTADHKWAARVSGVRKAMIRGPYKNRKPERRLIPAIELKTNCHVILAAAESSNASSLLTPSEAALLGWMVTDGTLKTVGNSRRIGICQSKEKNFAEIHATVEAASGGDFSQNVSPGRQRTFPSGRTYDCKPQHWWYLSARATRGLLTKCGYKTRESLLSIIPRLNQKARSAMLQAFMLAEGDQRMTFANTDPVLIMAFEMLCALNGFASGKTKRRVINGSAIFTKRLKKTRHVARSMCEIVSAGIADVWCPTTAFGTWIMRQGGQVCVTGNTKAKRRVTLSFCGLGMLDETEVNDEVVTGGAQASTAEHVVAIAGDPIYDWRDVRVHFGAKHGPGCKDSEGNVLPNGRQLGEMSDAALSWFQNTWEPRPDSAEDMRLRRALDISLGKAEADKKPEPAEERPALPASAEIVAEKSADAGVPD